MIIMGRESVNEYNCYFCKESDGEGKVIETFVEIPKKSFEKINSPMPVFDASYECSIGKEDCSVLQLYKRDIHSLEMFRLKD